MITVQILKTTDAGQVVIMTLDNQGPNGAVRIVSGKDFPESILTDEILIGAQRITIETPELWLRRLPFQYNNMYTRATIVRDTDPKPEKPVRPT